MLVGTILLSAMPNCSLIPEYPWPAPNVQNKLIPLTRPLLFIWRIIAQNEKSQCLWWLALTGSFRYRGTTLYLTKPLGHLYYNIYFTMKTAHCRAVIIQRISTKKQQSWLHQTHHQRQQEDLDECDQQLVKVQVVIGHHHLSLCVGHAWRIP